MQCYFNWPHQKNMHLPYFFLNNFTMIRYGPTSINLFNHSFNGCVCVCVWGGGGGGGGGLCSSAPILLKVGGYSPRSLRRCGQ